MTTSSYNCLAQFLRILGDQDVCGGIYSDAYAESYKLSRSTIIEHLSRLRIMIEILLHAPSPTPNTKIQDAVDAIFTLIRFDGNSRHELIKDIDYAVDSIRNDGDDWVDEDDDE